MATTRIMPLHIGKGRTESRAISEIIDYVANPQKTDHGRLITGYECDSRVADAEFMLAKRQYYQSRSTLLTSCARPARLRCAGTPPSPPHARKARYPLSPRVRFASAKR